MHGSYGVEAKIATVAGSPTLHFPDRARVPCLATLALILTGPVSFDSFRFGKGFDLTGQQIRPTVRR